MPPSEHLSSDQFDSPALQEALTALNQAQDNLLAMQWEIARAVEATLNMFTSRSMGSKEANKIFATSVNELLRRCAVRLVCSKCEAPAVLFLYTAGKTRHGSFQFEHPLPEDKRVGGRLRHTRHGGSKVVPTLSVIPILAIEQKKPTE